MSKKNGRRISGDPRKSSGDIVGPGGPQDRHGVILDDRNAVLLDHSTVTLVETQGGGGPVLAMLLEGRINKTTDRALNLYLMNEDGAAAIVTELIALASRISPEFGDRFTARIQRLIETDSFGNHQQGDPE